MEKEGRGSGAGCGTSKRGWVIKAKIWQRPLLVPVYDGTVWWYLSSSNWLTWLSLGGRRAAHTVSVIVAFTVPVCIFWSFWNRFKYDVLHSAMPNCTALHCTESCCVEVKYDPSTSVCRSLYLTIPSSLINHLLFPFLSLSLYLLIFFFALSSVNCFHHPSLLYLLNAEQNNSLATTTILISRYMSTSQYLPRLRASRHALFVAFLHTLSPKTNLFKSF